MFNLVIKFAKYQISICILLTYPEKSSKIEGIKQENVIWQEKLFVNHQFHYENPKSMQSNNMNPYPIGV